MDSNRKPLRYAAYCRVSTLLGQDPTLQLVRIKEYCQARDYELKAEYVEFASGTKERRPQLDQLVKDARARKWDVLVVTGVDRIGRNTLHLLTLITELASYGVSLISLREGLDFQTPIGKATLSILAVIAELEANLTRERIKTSMAAKKLAASQAGIRWVCGRPPIAQELVVKVLKLRADGLSLREIERALDRKVSRASIGKIIKENQTQTGRPETSKKEAS